MSVGTPGTTLNERVCLQEYRLCIILLLIQNCIQLLCCDGLDGLDICSLFKLVAIHTVCMYSSLLRRIRIGILY